MDYKTILLAIIRQVIMGQTEDVPELSSTDCTELLRLANLHDLGHIVAYWIESNRAPAGDELLHVYQRSRRHAVFRETRQEYVKGLLYQALEEAGIPFIPLKGICIRALYPEGWMRTSGDLDVLVHEEDLNRAVQVLNAQGFATDGRRQYHDIALIHSDIRVELHFNICEDMETMDRVLRRVWDYAEPAEGCAYRVTDAFFLFYHIAHMCYHFKKGGCGLRAFIDLRLMQRNGLSDGEGLTDLLRESCLLTFYESVCRMAAVWFDGAAYDPVTEAMEQYILGGGTYGSPENRGAVVAGSRTGRFSFLLHRLFPSVNYMKNKYPVLTRSKAAILLLPFMYVYRVIETICGRNRSTIGGILSEYRSSYHLDRDKIDSTARLMEAVGLDKL